MRMPKPAPEVSMSPDASTPDAAARSTRIREVYEANITLIYRFIYAKVGNREEAEDLTAQVFTKAVRDMDWTRDDDTARHWLFQVARTTMADHWRVTYRIPTQSLDILLDSGWEFAEIAGVAEVRHPRAIVATLLAQLSDHERDVLRCRFLLNLSIKETARHLGLSEANVKVLQFRGLKHAAALPVTMPSEEGSADEHA
jgi:RNA polymerase sigma-70 factor (ECF subfamily)